MYLLFAFAYRCIAWDIQPLVTFNPLIWKMKERRLDQALKFLCISFWSFHMHPIVLVYNSARIDQNIELGSAPKFFYTFLTCLKLASVMSFMFWLLQDPFPSGNEESFPATDIDKHLSAIWDRIYQCLHESIDVCFGNVL